jgi:hypothetical protein
MKPPKKKKRKKGYIAKTWTGLLENPNTGMPMLFPTVQRARAHIAKLPAWGRSAVDIHKAETAMGDNGKPDYFIGTKVG